MPAELLSWPRPHFVPGGGNPLLFYVVFGALDPKAGALESLFTLGRDTRLNHRFEVIGGVLRDESARRLSDFFSKLRAAGQK